MRTSGEQLVICPKCGEVNADNFRFCGMCGTVLERVVSAGPPKVERVQERAGHVALSIPANPPKARTEKPMEPISGPSLLGLGQPTMESLRDKAFSGADSFFEPEEPKTGGRKLLLLVLLVALGVAVWWTYTNYIAIGETPKQTAPATNATSQVPPEQSTAPQPSGEAKSTDAAPVPSAPAVAPAPAAAEKSPAQASAHPDNKAPATTNDATAKSRAKQKAVKMASAASPKTAAVASADNGDAAFRKGEAYLYGRGVTENCDEAIKYLKAASAQQHARARSTFGTMYATGHCVPRDLPTSYTWFALALRVDPNNQILEKDLSAIWNQMTPPERQLATKMKQ